MTEPVSEVEGDAHDDRFDVEAGVGLGPAGIGVFAFQCCFAIILADNVNSLKYRLTWLNNLFEEKTLDWSKLIGIAYIIYLSVQKIGNP